MHSRPHQATPFARWIILTLAVLLVMPAITPSAAAQPVAQTNPPLDIAALLLQPADLEAHGMPGMGLYSRVRYPSIEAALGEEDYAKSRGTTDLQSLDGAEALLQSSGWRVMHEQSVVRARSDEPDLAELEAWSAIEEYDSAAGAGAAWQELARQDRIQAMTPDDHTVEPVPSDTALGDQSSLWHISRPESQGKVSRLVLSRWVLVDNAIVSVNLTNYVDQEPDAAVVDSLTTLLVDRLDAARHQPGDICGTENPARATLTQMMGRIDAAPALLPLPGIAPCVAVFGAPASLFVEARYVILGGTVLLYGGEDAASLADRQAENQEIGIVHRYMSEQSLIALTVLSANAPAYINTTVTVYTDVEHATASFARIQDSMASDGFETTPLGPDRFAASHINENNGSHQSIVFARSGNIVVNVHIGRVPEIVLDAVGALVDAHLACFAAGGCAGPVPLPPELQ